MLEIGFIGAGNMGEALIAGLISQGTAPERIGFAEKIPERSRALAERYPGLRSATLADLVQMAPVLVLAVKPQTLPDVLGTLREPVAATAPLVLSIAAGFPLSRLQEGLGPDCRIIRAMPNTPALIGMGITGLFANENATGQDHRTAEAILGAVGKTLWLQNENDLHAVTAISGSGPAYVFLMLEALSSAGEALGLEPDIAGELAQQTLLGSATLARQENVPPATLRARVTSPGGTTEQALRVFFERGFQEMFLAATAAAAERSRELSQSSE